MRLRRSLDFHGHDFHKAWHHKTDLRSPYPYESAAANYIISITRRKC